MLSNMTTTAIKKGQLENTLIKDRACPTKQKKMANEESEIAERFYLHQHSFYTYSKKDAGKCISDPQFSSLIQNA